MLQAVIFDMDGVIYESTPYVWKARNIYLERYGVKISDKEVAELLGMSLRDQLAIINRKYNLSLDHDEFSRKTRAIQVGLMKEKLKPCEGVSELIDDLTKNGVRIAIASSNVRKFVLKDLAILKLRDKFKVITTADELEHHKPNPEIFLKTAEKLKVKLENCVVIEDALNGIEAAINANMKAVAVVTKFHTKEDFRIADLLVSSLKELDFEKIKSVST